MLSIAALVPLLHLLPRASGSAAEAINEAYLPDGFSIQTFSTGHGRTRSLHKLPNGDILLVKAQSRGAERFDDSKVLLFWDDDLDGIADGVHELVPPGHDLTHGIEYVVPENSKDGKGLLLASSDRDVFSWPYTHGDRASSLGRGSVLVEGMNARASSDDLGAYKGHWTRTLALSPGDQKYLYISVGSFGNVDVDSYRSRIRRFDLSMTETVFDFRKGEVFADGLRNEVGLAFDINGTLWGVENGADDLRRSDLGGDIHNDNPAEELNKFDGEIGTFYGYPYCFTEYDLPTYGKGRGTQWAWPRTGGYGANWAKSDEWCRANSRATELAMQAHSAPLGMTFFQHSDYDAQACAGKGTFPLEADGDAFVGFHGSWNRDVPTGYKVVRIPLDRPGGSPTGDVYDLLAYAGRTAKWPSGVRPVDVEFDQCGRLLVSDDGTASIFTISYIDEGTPSPAAGDSNTTKPAASNTTAAAAASAATAAEDINTPLSSEACNDVHAACTWLLGIGAERRATLCKNVKSFGIICIDTCAGKCQRTDGTAPLGRQKSDFESYSSSNLATGGNTLIPILALGVGIAIAALL